MWPVRSSSKGTVTPRARGASAGAGAPGDKHAASKAKRRALMSQALPRPEADHPGLLAPPHGQLDRGAGAYLAGRPAHVALVIAAPTLHVGQLVAALEPGPPRRALRQHRADHRV